MKYLAGKTALVTGGASGIGLGMVEAFVEQGMNVMIADVRDDHLEQARAHFLANKNVDYIKLDVTDREAMLGAAGVLEKRFGKLHILCNNAGVGVVGGIDNCSYDDWDWCLDVGLNGLFNGLKVFLPLIQKHNEGGHIVNTSSCAAALPGGFAYAAVKGGMLSVTEAMAGELAGQNIGSTCLMPGPVQSNIHEVAKLRPARYGNTEHGDIDAELADREMPEDWLEPITVGRMVVDAVQRSLLFIITHNEFREGIEQRFSAILASMPTGSASNEDKQKIGFPTHNPIYDRLEDVEPANANNIKSS